MRSLYIAMVASTARLRGAILSFALSTVFSCSPPEGSGPNPEESAAEPADAGSVFGTAPRAYGGFPSVVMFFPETPWERPRASEPALMDQFGNAFHPKLLLVRPGQPVEFRNSEDVVHNVHVIDAQTRATVFNVATPVVGAYTHVFESRGAFDVSCNMHNWMAAFIVVTDAPHVAVADKDGVFSVSDVPPGTYLARVWNVDGARRTERTVRLPAEGAGLSLVE